MHPSARLRLVGARAGAVGGIATLVGVLGHRSAGGDAPNPALFCLLWLLCSAISSAFLLRRAGRLRLASLLLVEQLLVHVGLMAFAMPSGATMPPMPGMPGMAASTASAMPAMGLMPSPRMLIMHALAAGVAGFWLWRGECTALTLIALAGASVHLLWRPVAQATTGLATPDIPVGFDLLPRWGLRCAQDVLRRGPPAALAV